MSTQAQLSMLLKAGPPVKATIGASNPDGFTSFSTMEDFVSRWQRTDLTCITCIVGNNYTLTDVLTMTDIDEVNFASDRTAYSFTSGTKHFTYTDRPLLIRGWGSDTGGSYTTIGTATLYADGRPITFKDIICNSQLYGANLNTGMNGNMTLDNFGTNKGSQYCGGVLNATTVTIAGDIVGVVKDSRSSMSIYAGFLNGAASFICSGTIRIHWISGLGNNICASPMFSTTASAVQSITLTSRTELIIDGGVIDSALGGPYATSSSKSFTTAGSHVIVNGGTTTGPVCGCGLSKSSTCSVNGDVDIEINGGSLERVWGGIMPHAIGSVSDIYCADAVVNGDITITLNGGTYHKDVVLGSGDVGQVNGNVFLDIGPDAQFADDNQRVMGTSYYGSFATPYVTGTRKLRIRSDRTLSCKMEQGSFLDIEIASGYSPTLSGVFDISRSDLKLHTDSHLTVSQATGLQTLTLAVESGAAEGEIAAFTAGFTPNNDGDEYDFKVHVEQNGTRTQATKVSDFEYTADGTTITIAQDYTGISYRRQQ